MLAGTLAPTCTTGSLHLGGNKLGPFLSKTFEAIGDYYYYYYYYYTTPGSPGSKNSTGGPEQEHRDRILDVAELAALPKGRGILTTGQNRAALVKSTPWMWTKHEEAVKASLLAHDPQAERTISDAESEADVLRRYPDRTPVTASCVLHKQITSRKNYSPKASTSTLRLSPGTSNPALAEERHSQV